MPKWYVTQYFSWTFEVEAPSEEEAKRVACDHQHNVRFYRQVMGGRRR